MARYTRTTDNRKDFDRSLRLIKDIDRSFVTIGINETQGSEIHPGNTSEGRRNNTSNVTVAEIAFFNEFGTATIPERSFIRSTVDEKRTQFERIRDQQLEDIILEGKSVKKGLDTLGFNIQQEIRNKIITLRTPPNAPSTIAKKGFNNPLIDSGRMLNSITFETKIK